MAYREQEFTQYIATDGAIYRFDDMLDKFLISETGFGMPPIRYITQRSPTQHGETIIDYRLEPRVIQLVHRRNACSREEYWSHRNELLNMIRPNRNGITSYNHGKLRRIFPDGSMRDIYVDIEQGPEFAARNPDRWDEWAFTETLRFIAPDPLFFDPVEKSAIAALDLDDGFTFPFSLPLIIGDDIIDDTLDCTTSGTEDTYPNIELEGPISGVEIINETLDLEIKLTYDVSYDETVTIYLEPGNKRIVSDVHGDITHTAYYSSDLATFRLAPHPTATNGTNVVRFHGHGLVAAGPTSITMKWYDRYIGI